jgi:glycerate kinase
MTLRKVIIAPDSFKGALTSQQVADVIAAEVSEVFPDCVIKKMPIADGGEGSIDTILSSVGGSFFQKKVLSPDDKQIEAGFGIAASGAAILEMAQSSGLTKQTGLNPMTSTTYGFGQLILAALERGARDFMLGIGGSATTDGGCGMASALGARFLDDSGKSFIPCGGTLAKITAIDTSGIDKRVAESSFTVMCDVDNPLHGMKGAACVYGPQKGANPEQITALDEGLKHLGKLLREQSGKDLAILPGAGAAGGLGAGCIAFLGAELVSGIDAILKLFDFKKHVAETDLIITGEGKLDSQSFYGKVLSGLLKNANGVPVWSVCGVCECEEAVLREHNLVVFETSEGISKEESMREAAKHLKTAARKAIQQIKATIG